MTQWTLTLKQNVDQEIGGQRIDASAISVANLTSSQPVRLKGTRTTFALTDLFSVESTPADQSLIDLQGDLSQFDHVAGDQRSGFLTAHGNVGDHLGSGMTGGRVHVLGNAGDRVAGAEAGKRKGMSGGRIEIDGNTGDQTGYRMRRGEIFIGGNTGHFLGSHMVAGTIVVAGRCGENLGYAMRRGSLLLSHEPEFPMGRFSEPVLASTTWLSLISAPQSDAAASFLKKLATDTSLVIQTRRGDAAVEGIGEVIFAKSAG